MKYTVILSKPPHDVIEDVYVANRLEEETKVAAIQQAQQEVFDADAEDRINTGTIAPSDYKVVLVFEGHLDPVWFGWQS